MFVTDELCKENYLRNSLAFSYNIEQAQGVTIFKKLWHKSYILLLTQDKYNSSSVISTKFS